MEQLKQLYYLIPIPLLLTIVINAINHWDATELEKKLMTNFQKMKINFSIIMFVSIFLTVFFSIIRFKTEGKFGIEVILSGLLISFLSLSISLFMAWGLIKFFLFKPKYYINLKDNERWLILKYIHNKKLLLQNGEKEFKTITNYDDLVIEREELAEGWRVSFYKKNKWFWILFWVLLIAGIINLAIMVSSENPFLKIFSTLFFAPSFVGIILMYRYPKIYFKYIENNKKSSK